MQKISSLTSWFGEKNLEETFTQEMSTELENSLDEKSPITLRTAQLVEKMLNTTQLDEPFLTKIAGKLKNKAEEGSKWYFLQQAFSAIKNFILTFGKTRTSSIHELVTTIEKHSHKTININSIYQELETKANSFKDCSETDYLLTKRQVENLSMHLLNLPEENSNKQLLNKIASHLKSLPPRPENTSPDDDSVWRDNPGEKDSDPNAIDQDLLAELSSNPAFSEQPEEKKGT